MNSLFFLGLFCLFSFKNVLSFDEYNYDILNNDDEYYYNNDDDYFYSDYLDENDEDEMTLDDDGTTNPAPSPKRSGSSGGSSRKGDNFKVTHYQKLPDTSTPELWNGMIVIISSVLDYNNNVMTHGLKSAKLLPFNHKDSKNQKWKLIEAGLTNWKFQNVKTKQCIGLGAIPKPGLPSVPKVAAAPPAAAGKDEEDDGDKPSAKWRINTQPCWNDKKDYLKSKYVEWELNSVHHRGKHMGNFYIINNPHFKSHGCFTFKNIATYSKLYFTKCKYGAPSQFIRVRCYSNCQFRNYGNKKEE